MYIHVYVQVKMLGGKERKAHYIDDLGLNRFQNDSRFERDVHMSINTYRYLCLSTSTHLSMGIPPLQIIQIHPSLCPYTHIYTYIHTYQLSSFRLFLHPSFFHSFFDFHSFFLSLSLSKKHTRWHFDLMMLCCSLAWLYTFLALAQKLYLPSHTEL